MKHLLGTALVGVLALAPTLAAAERLVIAGRDGGFGAALAMAVESLMGIEITERIVGIIRPKKT